MSYLERGAVEPYTISASQLMPTVSILNDFNDPTTGVNDLENWFVFWMQGNDGPKIYPIDCQELFESSKALSEKERQAVLAELDGEQKLCPDINSFIVDGGVSTDLKTFALYVLVNDPQFLEDNPNSVIVTTEISRYFNAEDFTKNGFQSPVTLSEITTYPKQNLTVEVLNYISKTSIEFFNFMWLDTSAITFTDFG